MLSERIYELDVGRSIALLMMMVYHTVFDLGYYFGYSIDYMSGFWYYIGRFSAISFMFISGVTSTVAKTKIRRGAHIFIIGIGISLTTYWLDPTTYIRFGILHLLGLSIMLYSILLYRLSAPVLSLLAITFLAAQIKTQSAATASELLVPLGFTPSGFISLDYYPLIPWYGIILLGHITGKLLYHRKHSYFPALRNCKAIQIPGRYTLLIYLVHQPIIITLLFLIKKII